MLPPFAEIDKRALLRRICESEDNFLLTQKAIQHLKKDGLKLEPGTEEWSRVVLLVQESNFIISHNYMRLALLKASLGIVGKRWYNEKADS